LSWRILALVGLAIASALLALLMPLTSLDGGNVGMATPPPRSATERPSSSPPSPPLQAHPLPPSLAQWSAPPGTGDYFDAVRSTAVGALVWTKFPVKVYAEPPTQSVTPDRSGVWFAAVQQAVQEWSRYLPLEMVSTPDQADILVQRTIPPLRQSGQNFRARAAETRYEVLVSRPVNAAPFLSHRFTVLMRPGLSDAQLLGTARHELGHALGIWGHSSLESDALYVSQVRTPPPISPRDVNTLKRVYQQSTRLGWPISRN
jgi:predicted Zn-dependent protease